MPVEGRAGVGFAVGGDVAVAGNARRGDARVAGDDGAAERGECLVLAQGAWSLPFSSMPMLKSLQFSRP